MTRRWPALGGLALAGAASAAQPSAPAGEAEYLADLPVVLTVSRLAQPLNETPGAVTVIDRDMIRMSGARNVAELMRLVPGFQVSDSYEALAPLVSYHGGYTGLSNQMQVLIDGRSVYGSYTVGSVSQGLQTIDLEDIERIEVLRGSNSAAYGARAFLGVINIITRDPATTQGVRVGMRRGQNGISDDFARAGWAGERAEYRISAGRRHDGGLTGAAGGNTQRDLNFRGDFHVSSRDDVQLRFGVSDQDARVGLVTADGGSTPRVRSIGMGYLQANWRRTFSADEDLQVSYVHGEERYDDVIRYEGPIFGFYGASIDASGTANNDTLGVQHTVRFNGETRVVWGAELRREAVRSNPVYGTDAWQSVDFRRLYANLEQRLGRDVVVNAGGMYENNSLSGSSFAPRVMLNWHVVRDHTLRAGVSKAYRPPSLYEDRVNQSVASTLPPPYPQVTFPLAQATGNLQPERLLAKEIGYLGEFRRIGLTADVRLFREQLSDGIGRQRLVSSSRYPTTFVNRVDFPMRGYEAQLQLRPRDGVRVIYNHATIHIDSPEHAIATGAPVQSDGLILFLELPGGVDLSLMHFQSSTTPWVSSSSDAPPLPSWRRFDARLGKRFQVGTTRGEVAIVGQNLSPTYQDYPSNLQQGATPGTFAYDPDYRFQRRVFVTLSLEI